MFDFLTTNPAVAMLKEDHERVQVLFDQFEATKSRMAKRKIVRAALAELKIHTALDRSSLKIIDPVLLVDQGERWAKLYDEIIVKGSR